MNTLQKVNSPRTLKSRRSRRQRFAQKTLGTVPNSMDFKMGTEITRFFSGTKEEADNGTSYELLYVGIAKKTDTFTRLLTAPMEHGKEYSPTSGLAGGSAQVRNGRWRNWPPTGMSLSWRLLLSFLPCCVPRR